MKGKVVIQSAFDGDYNSANEHMVYVSDSSVAHMNILAKKSSLADFGKSVNLRNSVQLLTVFPANLLTFCPTWRNFLRKIYNLIPLKYHKI